MTKPLEEIRALTATLLHPIEVDAYVGDITEESILQMQGATDVDLFTESKPNVAMQINRFIGHDMRYDGNYYHFRAGEDLPSNPENTACGDKWWRLPMSAWNHQFLSQRCGNHNNLAQLLFTRR